MNAMSKISKGGLFRKWAYQTIEYLDLYSVRQQCSNIQKCTPYFPHNGENALPYFCHGIHYHTVGNINILKHWKWHFVANVGLSVAYIKKLDMNKYWYRTKVCFELCVINTEMFQVAWMWYLWKNLSNLDFGRVAYQ